MTRKSKGQKNNNKIKEHTENYIHIPKPNLWCVLGLIMSGLLSWGWFNVLVPLWDKLDISTIMEATEPIPVYAYQWGILSALIIEYILISLFFVSVIALIKGGYNKLKPLGETGLMFSLVIGLMSGLIFGILFGIISGLIFGILFGILGGLIFGIVLGLIFGLLAGLILAFIIGLGDEFKTK